MGWLNKEQSLASARRLAYHIGKYGVPVSIELQPGSGSGHWGHDWWRAVLNHHIVSRRSSGLTPGRRLISVGRPDVPGPLANVYGGFDEVARLVTMGLANHPGSGGPFLLPNGTVIPKDQGRYYLLGTEFEGGLNEADWTDSYRRFMACVVAGKLDFINELRGGGITADFSIEHANWATPRGRKIDRLGYTRARGIAEVRAVQKSGGTVAGPSARSDEEIQLILGLYGLYEVGDNLQYIDGDNGPSQKAGVNQYQKQRGLSQDGWWGPQTNKYFEEHDMVDLIERIADRTTSKILNFKNPNNGTGQDSFLQIVIDTRKNTSEIVGRDPEINGVHPDGSISLKQEIANTFTVLYEVVVPLLTKIAESTGVSKEELIHEVTGQFTEILRRGLEQTPEQPKEEPVEVTAPEPTEA